MSPEQIQLAERIVAEPDPAKLTELVAELCRTIDARSESVMQAGEIPSLPAPK